jgi:hypothetical protein
MDYTVSPCPKRRSRRKKKKGKDKEKRKGRKEREKKKRGVLLGPVAYNYNPSTSALWRRRQGHHEFKTSLATL